MKERLSISGYGVICNSGVGFDSLLDQLSLPLVAGHISRLPFNGNSYPFGLLPGGVDVSVTSLVGLCLQELSDTTGYSRDRIISAGTAWILGATAGVQHRWDATFQPLEYQEAVNSASFVEYDLLSCLAREYGIRGPAWTVTTACASGGSALVMARNILQAGIADRVIIGSVELLNWYDLAGFSCAGLLSPDQCRPFDKRRNGLMLGEGSVFIMIEPLAKASCPRIEILAAVTNNDRYDTAAPEPDGKQLMHCITDALAMSGVQSGDIQYVNAHGTGTVQNDSSESVVFNALWAGNGCDTSISSTKGWHGHLRGASGLIGLLDSVAAISKGIYPPNIGCEYIEDDCAWNCVLESGRKGDIRYAVTINRGFGGINVATVISKIYA